MPAFLIIYSEIHEDVESLETGRIGITVLPFGALENPIESLHLSTMWSKMSEEVVTDNEVYR